MVTRWKSFGASVRGPGHCRACIPNQDSFVIKGGAWGNAIVVSDGVGSRPVSHFGSHTACRAVIAAARDWGEMNDSAEKLVEQIHDNWLSGVKPFSSADCAATCLFAIRPTEGQIVVGTLGDGLAGVLKTDGSYLELIEDKNDIFSNQTTALSDQITFRHWKTSLITPEECAAILLCTDGVADDLLPDKREGFVRHICQQAQKTSLVTAKRNLRKMLEKWPVPKHSDDKTLVVFYKCQE